MPENDKSARKELTLDEIYDLEAKHGCTVGSSLWRGPALITMFQKCIEGEHDQCIGQSDKLFRSGRLAICGCDCHKSRALLLDKWLGSVNQPVVDDVRHTIDGLLTTISDHGNFTREQCVVILRFLTDSTKDKP